MRMIDIVNQKVKYNKVYQLLVLGVLTCFVPMSLSAQSGSGSVYSIFGIGEINPTVSVQARGMGNASLGLTNKYYVNIVNPAANDMISKYSNHIFDAGLYMSSTKFETDDTSDNVTTGGLSNLNFWFKINDRWSSIIGLSQYSNVGYNVLKEDVSAFENSTTDVLYQGSGGLSEMYISNGFRLFGNLSAGAKIGFVFGNIDHTETISSSDVSTNYEVINETRIKGVYAEYSLNYRLDREKYYLNFGVLYKAPNSLRGSVGSKLVESGFVNDDDGTIYEEASSDEEYVVPTKLGFGLSFNTDKFTLTGEIQYNQWSKAEVSGYDDDLVDTWKHAAGLEITPNRFSDKTLQRISYRLGGYYENSYLEIDDTPINAFGITGGLGIPLRQGSTFNISYQQRFNGTTNNNLILESTNEVTINMTIRNRWFDKRKYN